MAFIFSQLEGSINTSQIKIFAFKSGECLSEKEGTGSFQLVNYSKLQMRLSSDYNYAHVSCSGAFHNGHFSCLGDFNYPPCCTGIISAGIRRPHVQEYLTKQSLKQSHFVFIMYLFDVGDQCVVNGAQ